MRKKLCFYRSSWSSPSRGSRPGCVIFLKRAYATHPCTFRGRTVLGQEVSRSSIGNWLYFASIIFTHCVHEHRTANQARRKHTAFHRRLRCWHCLTVIKKKKTVFSTMFSGYAYPYRRCRKRKLIAYANPLSYTCIVCCSTTLAVWPLIQNRIGIVVILRHFRIEGKRMCC